MPALEGEFLKEVSVRFAGENHLRTQKNTKQSSAQRFLNDPFPKTPFSAAEKCTAILFRQVVRVTSLPAAATLHLLSSCVAHLPVHTVTRLPFASQHS